MKLYYEYWWKWQIRITNNPADDIEPAWSPDGSKIAFSSNRDGIMVFCLNTDEPIHNFLQAESSGMVSR